jgi:aspartate/methionine/tyrosine aminotransferase
MTDVRQPFALERAYRTTYHSCLTDMSSSAAASPALGELLDASQLQALAGAPLAYEPGGGSYALRAAVASLYNDLDPGNVVITAGALEAIRAVAMALVKPGRRVLVQEPSYGALRQAVLDAGGLPVTAGADLAFLNSPHGPTGALMHDITSIAERVVVDEVYRPIELVPGTAPASCIDASQRAVSIGDLSKPLGLGGLRIGWIASHDRKVIERCADAIDYLSGSVSTLSATVALRALQRFDQLLAPHLQTARDNLATLASFVEAHRAWLDWDAPQAGYTACLRMRAGPPSRELFEALRDDGFFLLGGATFGMPETLRIGLGLPPAISAAPWKPSAASSGLCRPPASRPVRQKSSFTRSCRGRAKASHAWRTTSASTTHRRWRRRSTTTRSVCSATKRRAATWPWRRSRTWRSCALSFRGGTSTRSKATAWANACTPRSRFP